MKLTWTREEMHWLRSAIEREIQLCDMTAAKYDHFALQQVKCDFHVLSIRLQNVLGILRDQYEFLECEDGVTRWVQKPIQDFEIVD